MVKPPWYIHNVAQSHKPSKPVQLSIINGLHTMTHCRITLYIVYYQ